MAQAEFDAAALLSEGLRQADVGHAKQRTSPATTADFLLSYDDFVVAVRAAEIAHFQRVIQAAAANGIDVPGARQALHDLGVA